MKVTIEGDMGKVIEHRDWRWHFDDAGIDIAGDTLYELRENVRQDRMGRMAHVLHAIRKTYLEAADKESARSFSLGLGDGNMTVEFETTQDGMNKLSHLPEWVNPEGVLEYKGTVNAALQHWASEVVLFLDLTRDIDMAIKDIESCWMFSRSILDKHPEPEDADGQ